MVLEEKSGDGQNQGPPVQSVQKLLRFFNLEQSGGPNE